MNNFDFNYNGNLINFTFQKFKVCLVKLKFLNFLSILFCLFHFSFFLHFSIESVLLSLLLIFLNCYIFILSKTNYNKDNLLGPTSNNYNFELSTNDKQCENKLENEKIQSLNKFLNFFLLLAFLDMLYLSLTKFNFYFDKQDENKYKDDLYFKFCLFVYYILLVRIGIICLLKYLLKVINGISIN
jgi:hypothetical protein